MPAILALAKRPLACSPSGVMISCWSLAPLAGGCETLWLDPRDVLEKSGDRSTRRRAHPGSMGRCSRPFVGRVRPARRLRQIRERWGDRSAHWRWTRTWACSWNEINDTAMRSILRVLHADGALAYHPMSLNGRSNRRSWSARTWPHPRLGAGYVRKLQDDARVLRSSGNSSSAISTSDPQ